MGAWRAGVGQRRPQIPKSSLTTAAVSCLQPIYANVASESPKPNAGVEVLAEHRNLQCRYQVIWIVFWVAVLEFAREIFIEGFRLTGKDSAQIQRGTLLMSIWRQIGGGVHTYTIQ
jgi:hypothetical protein